MEILVCDDDEMVRKLLKLALTRMGHTAIECSHGDEVWKVLQDPNSPELLILDWNIPGKTGLDICKNVQSMSDSRQMYIILLTGRSKKEDILGALRAGASDYLIKPVDLLELEARISHGIQVLNLNKTLTNQKTKLFHSSKLAALGAMAAGLNHEINNPLAIISGTCQQMDEYVLKGQFEEKTMKTALDRIHRSVDRISRIIKGMSVFAKSPVDEPACETDLQKLIDDLVFFFNGRFRGHDVDMKFVFPSERIQISCSPVQLSHAILCLLDNAFESVCETQVRWINITVEVKSETVNIAIMDSGKGISPTIRTEIFKPFFTTKSTGTSVGLGLSIAKGIIEKHSGNIVLDPKSANTRFVVTLPKL